MNGVPEAAATFPEGWDRESARRLSEIITEDEVATGLREKWHGWTIERTRSGWLATQRAGDGEVTARSLGDLNARLAEIAAPI